MVKVGLLAGQGGDEATHLVGRGGGDWVGAVDAQEPFVVVGEEGLCLLLVGEHVEGALKAGLRGVLVKDADGPLARARLGGGVGLRELHDSAMGEKRGSHLVANIQSSRKRG